MFVHELRSVVISPDINLLINTLIKNPRQKG